MKQLLMITGCILLFNSLLFGVLGGYEIFQSYDEPWRTLTNSLYKIVLYGGPVVACIAVYQQTVLLRILKKLLRWYHSYRIYLLWIGYAVVMYSVTQSVSHTGAYSLLYILVVNSLVEEGVFRGYIQTVLTKQVGSWQAILIQAVLFACVHLPFYLNLYYDGHYDQFAQWFGWLGPGVAVLGLASPLGLGLLWGWLTDRTQSLWPAIVLHSLHNGILLFG